jgi:hypothetical protein
MGLTPHGAAGAAAAAGTAALAAVPALQPDPADAQMCDDLGSNARSSCAHPVAVACRAKQSMNYVSKTNSRRRLSFLSLSFSLRAALLAHSFAPQRSGWRRLKRPTAAALTRAWRR